jgi:hypothetical protein
MPGTHRHGPRAGGENGNRHPGGGPANPGSKARPRRRQRRNRGGFRRRKDVRCFRDIQRRIDGTRSTANPTFEASATSNVGNASAADAIRTLDVGSNGSHRTGCQSASRRFDQARLAVLWSSSLQDPPTMSRLRSRLADRVIEARNSPGRSHRPDDGRIFLASPAAPIDGSYMAWLVGPTESPEEPFSRGHPPHSTRTRAPARTREPAPARRRARRPARTRTRPPSGTRGGICSPSPLSHF